MRNVSSKLKRKRARPLSRYDSLPPELRGWLQTAALPWSTASVQKLWAKRLRTNGANIEDALSYLSQVEQKHLAKDTVWEI